MEVRRNDGYVFSPPRRQCGERPDASMTDPPAAVFGNHLPRRTHGRRSQEDPLCFSLALWSAPEQVADRLPKREALFSFVHRQLVHCARVAQPSKVRVNLPMR
jgi:hypothetical protein